MSEPSNFKQYRILAWVDTDAPNRSSKSPKYVTPMPTLQSMEQETTFDVTVSYGQVVNAQGVVTTPASTQTFTINTYVDPLTPAPQKGCSIAILRTDYKSPNPPKKKGLLVVCWIAFNELSEQTDTYFDGLLEAWVTTNEIVVLEYLWVPGTNTHITTSAIMTEAELALQLA
jgi:hypothetical protein